MLGTAAIAACGTFPVVAAGKFGLIKPMVLEVDPATGALVDTNGGWFDGFLEMLYVAPFLATTLLIFFLVYKWPKWGVRVRPIAARRSLTD